MSISVSNLATGSSAVLLPQARAACQAQPGAVSGRHRRATSGIGCLLIPPGNSNPRRASYCEHALRGAKGHRRGPRGKGSKIKHPLTTGASGAESAQTAPDGESRSVTGSPTESPGSGPGSHPGGNPGREFKTTTISNTQSFAHEAPSGTNPGKESRGSSHNSSHKHPLLQILPYLRPHWPLIMRAWVCTGIATACLLLFVPRLGQLSEAMGRGDLRGLTRKSCAVVALVAIRSLCTYLQVRPKHAQQVATLCMLSDCDKGHAVGIG